MRKPTIYEALVAKLGRTPTNAELKADVERIKREAIQDLAPKGKLRAKGLVSHGENKELASMAQLGYTARDRYENMIALINTYNEASSPSVPRTEEEHKVQADRARIALRSIKFNYVYGVDYKELSNGALWPIQAQAEGF